MLRACEPTGRSALCRCEQRAVCSTLEQTHLFLLKRGVLYSASAGGHILLTRCYGTITLLPRCAMFSINRPSSAEHLLQQYLCSSTHHLTALRTAPQLWHAIGERNRSSCVATCSVSTLFHVLNPSYSNLPATYRSASAQSWLRDTNKTTLYNCTVVYMIDCFACLMLCILCRCHGTCCQGHEGQLRDPDANEPPQPLPTHLSPAPVPR